jgi:DNA-binding transcriptional ArsR family regulator
MSDDELSTVFAALADPTRRAILGRLATGEATVNVIAEPFAMSVQAVSKHLKVLEQAGLISRGREAQWRPCRLEVVPLERAADWIETNRAIWSHRLDRLEQHLEQVMQTQQHQEEDAT